MADEKTFYEIIDAVYKVAIFFSPFVIAYGLSMYKLLRSVLSTGVEAQLPTYKKYMKWLVIRPDDNHAFVATYTAIICDKFDDARWMLRFINRQGTDTYTDVKILEILLAAKEGNWESARDKCALLRELAIDEQTKQRVEELISAVDGRDFGQLSQSTFYREAIERYPDEVKSHLRNLRVGMVVIVIILTYVVYKTII